MLQIICYLNSSYLLDVNTIAFNLAGSSIAPLCEIDDSYHVLCGMYLKGEV